MKKLLPLFLLGWLFMLYSCKEDDFEPGTFEEHSRGFKKSIVSFYEMKAKLSYNSGNALALFTNMTGKGGDDDYIRSIDSTYIVQFSNDTLTTYTMKVSTLDDENYSFSNLIIILRNDQESEELIAHYIPTNTWQDAYDDGEYIDYDGYINITDTNGNSIAQDEGDQQGKAAEKCEYYFVAVTENPCGCHDGDIIVGYILVIDCGSGSGWNPNDPNNPNQGNGWPTGPNPGGGFGDPEYDETAQQMNDYFGNGNWIEIINPPSNLPSFNSLDDAWGYIYGESSQGSEGSLVYINNTSNNHRVTHYKVKFWSVIWGERGIRMYITQTRDDEEEFPRPNILSITSQWYGGSFYNSWEQHENYDTETISSCTDCKQITIYGTLTQGFEFEDHGFFVKTEYKIQFKIDKLGNISNVYWWNID